MLTREEQAYLNFASKVSFFQFEGVEEFEDAKIDVSRYSKEIEVLKSRSRWTASELAGYLTKFPKSFWMFEALLQLRRFTNAQLIHFAFDVEILNSRNMDAVSDYALGNLRQDEYLRGRFFKELGENANLETLATDTKEYPKIKIVATFKMAVSDYINSLSRRQTEAEQMLEVRLASTKDFAERLAKYLLNNRKLNEMLTAINIREFLQTKQIPLDTKSLHGESAQARLLRILERNGYLKTELNEKDQTAFASPRMFAVQSNVGGIRTPKDKKLKRFDAVTILNGEPKHLIEVNFYTTTGTKIAINEEEYTDLSSVIHKTTGYKFIWVTDGNYWLTRAGEKMYKRLLDVFDGIYNLNTFEENLNLLT